jgi:hypothetical protein
MTKDCKLCGLISNTEKEVYFETEEVIVFKLDKYVYACPKQHKPTIEDNEASGMLKILMKVLGKYHPNHFYSLKHYPDKNHFCIYTIIE